MSCLFIATVISLASFLILSLVIVYSGLSDSMSSSSPSPPSYWWTGLILFSAGLCYTKILSPSCDKTFDIPTLHESQLLERKLNGFSSICHTNSQHRACPFIQERYPCSHHISLVVHNQCHCPFPLVHRRLLPEPLCHRRRSAVPYVKGEKEKLLEASRW